jgi:hypothetical protein
MIRQHHVGNYQHPSYLQGKEKDWERFTLWLWRNWLVLQKDSQSGFILPTVTLLLLVISLVTGMLVFRTFNRTEQVIGERVQRSLYNAATPAIDRGKAKIEYLFSQEASLSPLPSDEEIFDTFRTNTRYTIDDVGGSNWTQALGEETRIDLNGDGTPDNAWIYAANVDDDSDVEYVVYSLTTRLQQVSGTVDVDVDGTVGFGMDGAPLDSGDLVTTEQADSVKADHLVVRNGPINLASSNNTSCPDPAASPSEAWQTVTGSTLRKAVQVHAVVWDPETGVSATLEMQQDKQADLGNKWGAWFRYDFHLFPGPLFNFNGAMHTEGSFLLNDGGNTGLNLFLISDPDSCVYSRTSSEITMTDRLDNSTGEDFEGQFYIGSPVTDVADDDAVAHIFDPTNPVVSGTDVTITPTTDSTNTGFDFNNIKLNPILVLTEDKNESVTDSNPDATITDYSNRSMRSPDAFRGPGKVVTSSPRPASITIRNPSPLWMHLSCR